MSNFVPRRLAIATVLSLLTCPLLAQAEIKYSVSTIFDSTSPFGGASIAANGDIAGNINRTVRGETAMFFYTAATGTAATLSVSGNEMLAGRMNDYGVLAGTAVDTTTYASRGFVYDHGALTYLGDNTTAGDINNAGVVAGSTGRAVNAEQAATFVNGVASVIATGSRRSYAITINNQGTVGGAFETAKGNEGVGGDNGFISSNGQFIRLNTGSTTFPVPQNIASDGSIAGYQLDVWYYAPTAWAIFDGKLTYLGGLHDFHDGYSHSAAYDVNKYRQVVGSAEFSDGTNHGFLYENGLMTDINALVDPTLNLHISSVSGINDRGQIVGTSCKSSYTDCSVILLNPLTAPVPEPETYAMLLGGLGLVGVAARRRRQRAASGVI